MTEEDKLAAYRAALVQIAIGVYTDRLSCCLASDTLALAGEPLSCRQCGLAIEANQNSAEGMHYQCREPLFSRARRKPPAHA